ncbi:hypothetical protein C4D60_Mb08t07170 [Musa balbisiana]|uniref:Uncharacterized protein n=1 Tax=Musa balbisiana TaxID=52838 RepID=A0A4S8K223_MUSBA|nr:hypothetical protein C4D60_Mb08t07170 [Musa balbisiana]
MNSNGAVALTLRPAALDHEGDVVPSCPPWVRRNRRARHCRLRRLWSPDKCRCGKLRPPPIPRRRPPCRDRRPPGLLQMLGVTAISRHPLLPRPDSLEEVEFSSGEAWAMTVRCPRLFCCTVEERPKAESFCV